MRSSNGIFDNEPPTLIADLNGNIIYVSSKANSQLYPVKVGDSISKYVDLNYIRKMSLFDNRIDVVVPKNCKFEKLVVKVVGSGAIKTIELCFMHGVSAGDDEILRDKKLLSMFSEIIGNDITESVKLNDFTKQIVECMKMDLRFAYRKFDIVKMVNDDRELFINYKQLSTITIGMIIALNEIEYRNPIRIVIDKILNEYVLSISVQSNTFKTADGLYEFMELYPEIAMRIMFLTTLCDNNEIKYKFSAKPNMVTTEFIITDAINKTGKFSCSAFGLDQRAFVSYIMDMFINDTSKEEQE